MKSEEQNQVNGKSMMYSEPNNANINGEKLQLYIPTNGGNNEGDICVQTSQVSNFTNSINNSKIKQSYTDPIDVYNSNSDIANGVNNSSFEKNILALVDRGICISNVRNISGNKNCDKDATNFNSTSQDTSGQNTKTYRPGSLNKKHPKSDYSSSDIKNPGIEISSHDDNTNNDVSNTKYRPGPLSKKHLLEIPKKDKSTAKTSDDYNQIRNSVSQLLKNITQSEANESYLPGNNLFSNIEMRINDSSGILNNSVSEKLTKSCLNGGNNSTLEGCSRFNNLFTDMPDIDLQRLFCKEEMETSVRKCLENYKQENPKPMSNLPFSNVSLTNKDILKPNLISNEGYFQIGPPETCTESFEYSVTIIYAKNLKSLINIDLHLHDKGFFFTYSLMGDVICNDTFYNLEEPEFKAEKTTATIMSSSVTMAEYIQQHSFLTFYLMANTSYSNAKQSPEDSICIGSCVVDIIDLANVKTEGTASLEGVYKISFKKCMSSMTSNDSKDSATDDETQPYVALMVSLTKSIYSVSDRHTDKTHSKPILFADLSSSEMDNTSDTENDVLSSDSDSDLHNISSYVKRKQACIGLDARRKTLEWEKKCGKCGGKSYSQLSLQKSLQRQRKKAEKKMRQELQEWKETEMMEFNNYLAEKEKDLLSHLSDEWKSKIKGVEQEYSQRQQKCDKLQQELIQGLQ